LEIGSYEGASTCFLIDQVARERDIELHCVDTWAGGIEHQAGGTAQADMGHVERTFTSNIALAHQGAVHAVDLHVKKGYSHHYLSELLASGRENYFDFIYVSRSMAQQARSCKSDG
jgi:hypothetical protein